MFNTTYVYCLIMFVVLCFLDHFQSVEVSDFIACNSVKDCWSVLYSSWFFLCCSENESQALCYRHTDRSRKKGIDKIAFTQVQLHSMTADTRKKRKTNKQTNKRIEICPFSWLNDIKKKHFINFFSNSNAYTFLAHWCSYWCV